jgi:peroxiredoxin
VPLRGLPIGTKAPAFQLAGLRGETLTLESLRAADMPVLLTFSDPQCGPCNALMPDLGRWQREHASRVSIALISRGSAEANRNKASEHGVRSVLLQQDREIAERYLVTGTPSAVLVAADGTIASALAEGADAIAALVGHATGTPASVTGTHDNCGAGTMVAGAARLGDRAPAVRLPDLDGAIRDLAARREATAVLFWNPSCGFCQQMLEQVKAWEARPPDGAPGLLIVSTGSVEANQALGLRSTILLDQQFATARAFGATGTPSSVLVDAEGKIASLVAVGAPAVMSVLAPTRAIV